MWDVIFEAHQKARDILKAGSAEYPVGMSLALMDIQAVEGGEENAAEFRKKLTKDYLERLKSVKWEKNFILKH